jgi:hypothetical protein
MCILDNFINNAISNRKFFLNVSVVQLTNIELFIISIIIIIIIIIIGKQSTLGHSLA